MSGDGKEGASISGAIVRGNQSDRTFAGTARITSIAVAGWSIPAALFATCIAAQLYLVFFKSFNWDEYLHYGFFYQMRAGTLELPFQVLHLRALWWAPHVATDLLDQMIAARLFAWSLHLVTLVMIYGVSRQFTNASNSFFACFAYLTAGYVFTHGFSIRSDPFAAATLMAALFLMARGRLTAAKAIAVGALIGIAGMITLKAVLYAGCFAGLAWLKVREGSKKVQVMGAIALLLAASLFVFGVIYSIYAPNTVEAAEPVEKTSELSFYLRWFSSDLQYGGYIVREVILAPLFFICLLLAPFSWRKAGLSADARLALAGFMTPLLALLVYRNTFPYFFVFLLAPLAVAIAPALGVVRERYGNAFVAIVLSATPLALAMLEPRDMIQRQRALSDYLRQEFPQKTGYLDYSGMMPDYPRIIPFLTSGNGMRLYRDQGDPIIAREIDRGNVPFIIANQEVLLGALEGQPMPNNFLPEDLAAIRGNYVRQWGVLWREGTQIPAGSEKYGFQLRRGGIFALAGEPVTIDGVNIANGSKIMLEKGLHRVSGRRKAPSTLWRGNQLPTEPPAIPLDSVFTEY